MPQTAAGKPPAATYGANDFYEALTKQTAKEIVKGSDMKTFFVALVVKGSIETSKVRMSSVELPKHVVDGIADQFTVAYELLKTGKKLTPRELTQIFAKKAIGISKIATGNQQAHCAISVASVAVSVAKASGALLFTLNSGGAGTGALLVQVAELMQGVYDMDQKCGITEATKKAVNDAALPIFMRMHREIYQRMGVPGY